MRNFEVCKIYHGHAVEVYVHETYTHTVPGSRVIFADDFDTVGEYTRAVRKQVADYCHTYRTSRVRTVKGAVE